MDTKDKIKVMLDSLQAFYPAASLELNYSSAFELLIAVILSAQCTDARVNQVTQILFKKYKSPQDYIEVDLEELENDIRPSGFYRNKAKLIRGCCETLIRDYESEVPVNIQDMISLPGVGRKTAAMVLGNASAVQQGIAVDTHVKRVVQRLGISPHVEVDKIEQNLMRLVHPEKWTFFSNATILFGRNICQSRKPRCSECPFKDWCPSPDKTI
ncbi:MAG: endonuclease III [bacterium]|nr:MAG: endonuclease III [bacterium]